MFTMRSHYSESQGVGKKFLGEDRMGVWHLNIWQRIVFGLAAALCFLGAFSALDRQGEPLLSFLWGVFFLAVTVSPRPAPAPAGDE